MPARLLALYTIPKDGLTNEVRTALALCDDKHCVQSYATSLESLTEEQVTGLQRTMQCVGTNMQTLEGLDDYHQLPVAQEVQKQEKGEGAEVIGNGSVLLGEVALHMPVWRASQAMPPENQEPKIKKKTCPRNQTMKHIYTSSIVWKSSQTSWGTQTSKKPNNKQNHLPQKKAMERLRQAEVTANQAEKNKKREQLKT